MRHHRINLVILFVFLFAAAIISRLIFLQIIQHDLYSALAKGQQIIFKNYQGDRGKIFFQNHDLPIATNKTSPFLYLSPNEIPAEEKENTSQVLAGLLNLDQDFILEKTQQDNLFALVKDKLSDQEVASVQEADLAGVHLGEEKLRSYPYEDFAAHLLGFVNKEGEGQYGVEEYWDEALRGEEGFLQGEWGPLGYLFFSERDPSLNQGADLFLTIDYNIQYAAEKLLKKARENLNIEGGQIVVVEPSSGKILALANFPTFNLNGYAKEKDFEVFQNGVTQKAFEPGSVFKSITMAAALDEGKITSQTTYFDPGCYQVGVDEVCNYEKRIYPGELTMTNVLEKSINTGAVFAERELGNKNFLEYVEKFGIFSKTGVDLPWEISPPNKEFKQGREINYATASFGQGIEMTPLQLIRAFCAIANGGKLVKPYLVEKIVKNGEETMIEPEVTDDDVISPGTSSKITAMLVSVVGSAYTKAAQIPGYYVAGKTGTAQISYAALGMDKKGYSEKTWQSFIGFAPAFNPKFLIMVKLNNPATRTAEYSAVPIFQELAKYIIDYYQIPPDHEPR
ncbi:MAG: hypothetical protein COT59_00435 [Candidatus Nealsonbacteria bacterium CG09_land_8_20_14_0_10_42_14]|uniref:Penicillin-binding protein transpeptidase domain-containing protein n=1 Tax=Candidatus Nealsonbacteria bacterium CG09_land_8_20_14_0_10_42_14 TaxID=1974707 RepID=A0A2H0WXT0_9BACT|nr:MAG: hypothetical protein COT59_00435 [Candidatus Nealsonbacteria bacterium CG09_land_8_20_14_0_10_42_14]